MKPPTLVQTREQAARLVERLVLVAPKGRIGLDTEMSGPQIIRPKAKTKRMCNLYTATLTGTSLAHGGDSWYVPIGHDRGNLGLADARRIMQAALDVSEIWIHNAKHDVALLSRLGWAPDWLPSYRDSMVACWMANLSPDDPPRYGLKKLAGHLLGLNMADFTDVTGESQQFCRLTPTKGLRYAAEDAWAALRLGELGTERMSDKQRKHFLDIEMPFVRVLMRMERKGMRVDTDALLALREHAKTLEGPIREDWETLAPGVSITSPVQIKKHFYEGGIWSTKGVPLTPKREPKADNEALELHAARYPAHTLAGACARLKIRYQELAKILNQYTTGLVSETEWYPDGRIHPSYHQCVVRTGRQSCTNPNLQQIPVHSPLGLRVKRAFVPSYGYRLVSADYSQVELRVLADMAPGRLSEAFEQGADPHEHNAQAIGCPRSEAKTLIFSYIYGAGDRKLASQLGKDLKAAKQLKRDFGLSLPELPAFRSEMIRRADTLGYAETISGRRRYLPGLQYTGYRRWAAERLAVNTPVQGGAADVVKAAMVDLDLAFPNAMIAQVHDEVCLELPELAITHAAQYMRDVMERAGERWGMKVPLVAEPMICDNWAETKE